MDYTEPFETTAHDPSDPDPQLAIYLDESIPIHSQVKAALLLNQRSRSRQFLLPVVRPLARISIILIQLLKIIIPNRCTSSRLLHRLIYWGLKHWVSPEANYLILRHFHVGSEILEFLATNIEGGSIELNPLKPIKLEDVKEDLFLKHDLNLYNFIIRLNKELKAKNKSIQQPRQVNFDCITEGEFSMETFPNKWTNIIDIQTAIEIYTPLYQLFLTDNDFWRASNSLQLDETIAIYVSKILGDPSYLALVNNKHPLVPLTTLRAGFRLMTHGLASETLHEVLIQSKKAQENTQHG